MARENLEVKETRASAYQSWLDQGDLGRLGRRSAIRIHPVATRRNLALVRLENFASKTSTTMSAAKSS